MKIFTAKCLLPVSSPPVKNGGAVAVEDGRIIASGRKRDVLKEIGSAVEPEDLGDVILMPGVVNAHTHLDLAWFGADPPPAGECIPWLEAYERRRQEADEGLAKQEAEKALAYMVSRGTAAVGDVSRSTWTVPLLAGTGLYATVFLELQAFLASDAEPLMESAADRIGEMERLRDDAGASDRIRIVLSPHSAHSTAGPLLKALAGRASATDSALSIHLSESDDERTMLQDGEGALTEYYRRTGVIGDDWRPPGFSAIQYIDRLGVLSPRTLAVHCVHVNRQELSILQARGVAVVACPRSNTHMGVGVAPVPGILASGIPVALGTESLASSPDMDIFAEMAALRSDHPALSPAAVVRMATLNGARVLGVDGLIGSLDPGKLARMAHVPLVSDSDDPLEVVTSNPESVTPLNA
jgi:cytosine/adenosine deaminase-related metal-dependent hydrolase